MYNRAKACIYLPMELILNLKKRYVSTIFKKISPKTFGPHCVGAYFEFKKKGMCLQFLKKSVLKLLDRTVY